MTRRHPLATTIRALLPVPVAMTLVVALLALGVTAVPAAGAPQASAAVHDPTYGQRGAAVRRLQTKLIEAGVLRPDRRTGYFGTNTRAAVRTSQQRAGLRVTGRVDAVTLRAIDRARAARTGPRTWYQREVIGRSTEGRDMVAYRAGEPGKPVVVVTATMHGEEDFAQYVVRGLMQGDPITGVDLWLVPVLNPDGLAKDRRWVGQHIDLNRNFPHRFVQRANSGPRAASVRETRVIMAFLDRIHPRYLVSWHQPLFGVDSYEVKDKALMKRLSRGLDIPIKSLDCHGSCHGTMTGWYNARHPGAAITVEYGSTARSLSRLEGRDADAVLSAVGGRRRR